MISSNKHIVYFLGIGGVGMSALARYFNHNGVKVAGYDLTETSLTQKLITEGISITYNDSIESLPNHIANDSTIKIIYTPAIPKSHPQLIYFKEKGYILKKRAEILGEISKEHFGIAVAGTHGKTTTSSMIAHILNETIGCNAFVGGIMSNYDTNVLLSKNNKMVVEADEFDNSFLTLHPNLAIITSTDADHLDIYGSHNKLLESFQLFANQVKDTLITKYHLNLQHDKSISYGINEENADYTAYNVRIEDNKFIFDIKSNEITIQNIELLLPGYHNVENATASIIACLNMGLSIDKIKNALKTYKGVKRRFEYIIQNDNFVMIDDYAHHPTEIKVLVESVKALYPNKKITAIFQPHLYSRTRDFADEFAHELSKVNELFLMDIYPARETPIEGITSQWLLDKIELQNKTICNKENVIELVSQKPIEVLLTVGAGDIGQIVSTISKNLNYKVV